MRYLHAAREKQEQTDDRSITKANLRVIERAQSAFLLISHPR